MCLFRSLTKLQQFMFLYYFIRLKCLEMGLNSYFCIMIELIKHIEILLLENDCVIVPEFGGFITYYQPAHYEEKESAFLPPIRTVGFNPQLIMNDGVLAQAYMQTYHTDFPDAVRKIAEKVNEMKEILYKEGMVEMPGIGVLHYTIYNTFEFHPNVSGVLSPTLYALDAFTMKPLSVEVVADEPMLPRTEQVEDILPVKEKKEFLLNSQWLRNAVAVAVAAILFFVMSVPVENTYVDKGVYASLGTDCLFDAIRSQSVATSLPKKGEDEPQTLKTTDIVPVKVKVEKVVAAPKTDETPKPVVLVSNSVKTSKSVETSKPTVAPKLTVVKNPKKNYHIIVASLTTSADAKRMLRTYREQGYADAVVKENKGRFRISLCSYTDKSVAYQKMEELKKNDAFKGAWMLTSK